MLDCFLAIAPFIQVLTRVKWNAMRVFMVLYHDTYQHQGNLNGYDQARSQVLCHRKPSKVRVESLHFMPMHSF